MFKLNRDVLNSKAILCSISVLLMVIVINVLMFVFLNQFYNIWTQLLIFIAVGIVHGYIFEEDIRLSIISLIIALTLYIVYLAYEFLILSPPIGNDPVTEMKIQFLEGVVVISLIVVMAILVAVFLSMFVLLSAYITVGRKRKGHSAF